MPEYLTVNYYHTILYYNEKTEKQFYKTNCNI